MSALNILFYITIGAIAFCVYAAYVRNNAIHSEMLRELNLVAQSSEDATAAGQAREDSSSAFFYDIKTSSEDDLLYRMVESGFQLLGTSREEGLDLIGGGLPRRYEQVIYEQDVYLHPGQSASA